jgi:hypothetical protein
MLYVRLIADWGLFVATGMLGRVLESAAPNAG